MHMAIRKYRQKLNTNLEGNSTLTLYILSRVVAHNYKKKEVIENWPMYTDKCTLPARLPSSCMSAHNLRAETMKVLVLET